MGRWEPDAGGRLREAALDLYVERGYEQTTVAEIAQRAGLTARTFFRHFADKREVLFANSSALTERLVGALAAAPLTASPMEAVAAALDAAAEILGQNHAFSSRRQGVIEANAELRERELIKLATLADALADASLAAQAGIVVMRVAFERWVAGPGDGDLAAAMRRSLERLKTVATTR
ncbi:TetR family transcriptional regulator [Virgisporangium aurantiacum]